MRTSVCFGARAARRIAGLGVPFAVVLAAQLVCAPRPAAGQVPDIVRVEEDWELVIGTPDPDSTAPQVSCTMSPTANLTGLYATLELNFQSQPDFVAGGLQLQLWHGERAGTSHKFPQSTVLAQPGETVRWTQTMTLQNSILTFEVVNGQSVTWGEFGGQGYLRGHSYSGLTNLNAYDPEVSVDNSGVGYAANRVVSLQLKAVRLVTADGQVLEDRTLRQVHPRD
jgi:hypothetical protein